MKNLKAIRRIGTILWKSDKGTTHLEPVHDPRCLLWPQQHTASLTVFMEKSSNSCSLHQMSGVMYRVKVTAVVQPIASDSTSVSLLEDGGLSHFSQVLTTLIPIKKKLKTKPKARMIPKGWRIVRTCSMFRALIRYAKSFKKASKCTRMYEFNFITQ